MIIDSIPFCSALYVVDLKKFRETAAGDNLRVFYETLSKDPNSLANLDQVRGLVIVLLYLFIYLVRTVIYLVFHILLILHRLSCVCVCVLVVIFFC